MNVVVFTDRKSMLSVISTPTRTEVFWLLAPGLGLMKLTAGGVVSGLAWWA